MKKILFGTTAVALVAASSSAFAADKIEMGITGQWGGGFLIIDQDNGAGEPGENLRSSNFVQASELAFTGRTDLDNGITVGVRIELEGESSPGANGDQIDDSEIFFDGNFGTIRMGSDNMASDKAFGNGKLSASVAPRHGDTFDGDYDASVGVANNATKPGATGSNAGEAPGIGYYSPAFAGFQVGVSYQSDSSLGDRVTTVSNNNGADDEGEVISAGLFYNGDFSSYGTPIELNVGVGYERISFQEATATTNRDESDLYNISAKIAFGNFAIGAAFERQEDEFASLGGVATEDVERDDYFIGVQYTMDALSFGLAYNYREIEQDQATGSPNGDTSESELISLSAAYDLGAGVTIGAGIEFFDNEDDRGLAPGAEVDNSGMSALLVTNISF